MKRKSLMLLLSLTMMLLVIMNSDRIIKAENSEATGMNVEYHTQNEIREYFRENKSMIEDTVTYSINPCVSGNYSAGEVSSASLNSALNMLNQIRYVAGISHNITLDEDCTIKAQAAALLNVVYGYIDYELPMPVVDMEEALYNLGADGDRNSFIARGFPNIDQALLGWLSEDIHSIHHVGHRRGVLNPDMLTTGFGMVGEIQMMNFGGDYTLSPYYRIAWPAQTMPLDYFKNGDPWSVTIKKYSEVAPIIVTLTRKSDNRIWRFLQTANNSDKNFDINYDPYGNSDTACIIFRPEGIEEYNDGDEFRVEVTGLYQPLSYTVTFFKIDSIDSISLNKEILSMKIEEDYNLKAKILPSKASDDIVWTSSDEAVVSVKDGKLYAKRYGVATITVSSDYGSKSATCKVTVNPEQVKIIKISSTKPNQMDISWKNDILATGYEIVYALDKMFKLDFETVIVSDATLNKKTFKNLKAGKVYYIKVRSYKTTNGETVYGKFSSIKRITIRKTIDIK